MSVLNRKKAGSTLVADNGEDKASISDDTRVNITINAEIKENVDEVRRNTGKSTLSEVFRQALFFYIVAYKEHKKGGEILIRDSKGNTEKLRMFI